jgi:hypothetical protein
MLQSYLVFSDRFTLDRHDTVPCRAKERVLFASPRKNGSPETDV